MCFSPTASFTATTLLMLIGIASIKKAPASKKMFAYIPLVFALQQAFEGALWLILLKNSDSILRLWAGYGFLFFAFILWPTWIPYACAQAETNRKRKQVLHILTGIGFGVSLLLFSLMITKDITIQLNHNHIYYALNIKDLWYIIFSGVYLIATITPLFVSSMKRSTFFGILLAASCLTTYMIWYTYFTSVWCFFAAILSLGVYFIVS